MYFKRLYGFAAMLVTVACVTTHVGATSIDTPSPHFYYFDAGDLRQRLDSSNQMMGKSPGVEGLIESHEASGYVLGIADAVQGVYACPSRFDRMSGVMTTTTKYFDDHPELDHQSAAKVVMDALRSNYPCPGKP